jgi:hypothetical protein
VDVFSPLSALDAFSICLTSFATNVGLEPWATEEVLTRPIRSSPNWSAMAVMVKLFSIFL